MTDPDPDDSVRPRLRQLRVYGGLPLNTHCPACRRDLGRNDVVEPFPVGRRLAFDPAKGRLWVLCGRCRSWNLAPLRERWEAIEAAERAFESAVVGASTATMALARARDGTRLLRVGPADRRELAAWRYGERIRGRAGVLLRRAVGWGFGGGLGLAAAAAVIPPVAAFPGSVVLLGIFGGMGAHMALDPKGTRIRVRGMRVGDAQIPGWHLSGVRLRPNTRRPEGWELELPRGREPVLTTSGSEATRVLRGILPAINSGGGNRHTVDNAVAEVVRLGSSEGVLRAAAEELDGPEAWQPYGRPVKPWFGRPPRHHLAGAHPVLRTAVEMAVNEDVERRALEGELALLEREWREAEELAAISDDLLLPASVRERLGELRSRLTGGG